jgi:hypothetical protein
MKKSLLLVSLLCAAVAAIAHAADPAPVPTPAPVVVVSPDGEIVQPSAAESEASGDCGKSWC